MPTVQDPMKNVLNIGRKQHKMKTRSFGPLAKIVQNSPKATDLSWLSSNFCVAPNMEQLCNTQLSPHREGKS